MNRGSRITAAGIAQALGGHPSGAGYVARCPAHDDRTPSLSIADSADGADGRVLVHCHAGCPQHDVIAALAARGLWYRSAFNHRPTKQHRRDILPANNDAFARRERALEIWKKAVPVSGTLVEAYLRYRGITNAAPSSIRFHERLWHSPSASAWPAMVTLITDALSNEAIGIHRTFLDFDGQGKAPVAPSKMMLGSATGGVVRLGEALDEVMVGEGIETCLSVAQACGIPTWAALSASGLKAVNLPPGITRLTILADGDPTGEAAAQAAAQRWRLTVRTVRIVRAPTGRDFNDLIKPKRSGSSNDE